MSGESENQSSAAIEAANNPLPEDTVWFKTTTKPLLKALDSALKNAAITLHAAPVWFKGKPEVALVAEFHSAWPVYADGTPVPPEVLEKIETEEAAKAMGMTLKRADGIAPIGILGNLEGIEPRQTAEGVALHRAVMAHMGVTDEAGYLAKASQVMGKLFPHVPAADVEEGLKREEEDRAAFLSTKQ